MHVWLTGSSDDYDSDGAGEKTPLSTSMKSVHVWLGREPEGTKAIELLGMLLYDGYRYKWLPVSVLAGKATFYAA